MDEQALTRITAGSRPRTLTVVTVAWRRAAWPRLLVSSLWQAGYLILDQGRLRYICGRGIVFDRSRNVIFDVPVDAVTAVADLRLSMGTGLALTIAGRRHALSFIQPYRADSMTPQDLSIPLSPEAEEQLRATDPRPGREAGRRAVTAWKHILGTGGASATGLPER